jgi:hypothetical protein
MVLIEKICAENLNALCAKTSIGDERTEWIEKEIDKEMKESEHG